MSPPPPGPIYSFLASLPLPRLPYAVERWIPGQSPFSTHTEVVAALAAYLAIIFGGQFLMKGSKPYRTSFGTISREASSSTETSPNEGLGDRANLDTRSFRRASVKHARDGPE